VLRLAPSLAPGVLDLVADRSEPPLALVRGDAYRLVGQEIEARRAFADAAREPDPFDWIGGSRPAPGQDAEDAAEAGHPELPPPTDQHPEGDPA
jgi:hypothetical protein